MDTDAIEVDGISAQLCQVLTDYAAGGGDFSWIHDGWREESIVYPLLARPIKQLVWVGQFYAWWLHITSFGQNRGGRMKFNSFGGSLTLNYPDSPNDWERPLSLGSWDEAFSQQLVEMLNRDAFYLLFNWLDAGMDGQLYEALDNQLLKASDDQLRNGLEIERPDATFEEIDAAMVDQPVRAYLDGLKAWFANPTERNMDEVQALHPEDFPLSPTTVYFMMDNRYKRAGL